MEEHPLAVTIAHGRVNVVGDLDVSSVDLLRLVLQPYAGRRVTMDLSDVTFIDATGLNALLAVRRADTALEVINTPASVRRVFELGALTEELGVV